MSRPTPTPFPEGLLEQTGWVRKLSARLVRDPGRAEDVAQDTWLAAVRHPPEPGRPVRGWLATIARNLVRQAERGDQRRLVREAAAARPDAQPVTADVVERLFLHQRVVAAVGALDEPYRTTILLRHFDGLAPQAIARRLAVPVATVKTRLARGHEMLRARLADDAPGGRRPTLALLPLLMLPRASLITGWILMKTKVAVALLLLSAGLAAWWYADAVPGGGPGGAGRQDPASLPVVETAENGPAPAPDPIATSSFREAEAPAPADAPAAPEAASAAVPAGAREAASTLRGRALDDRGAPAAGLAIRFDGGPPDAPGPVPGKAAAGGSPPTVPPVLTGVTGPDGRFALPPPAAAGWVVSADPVRATVIAGSFNPAFPGAETVVIVAAARSVAGRVEDESGTPLAGAEVAFRLPAGFRSRFDAVLDHSAERDLRARSAEDGTFALDALPAVAGAVLQGRLDPFAITEVALDTLPATEAVLVLRRPEPKAGCIQGQVVDAGGRLAPGAFVALARASAVADERGMFVLDLEKAGGTGPLRAVQPGFQPAVLAPPKGAATRPEDWPPFILLRLGGPALELAGRVVDAGGMPVPGVQVFAGDPTLFGRVGRRNAVLENLMAGSKETVFDPVITGDDGRFVLRGLLPRDYPVRVHDPATLLLVEAGPFRAGRRDVEIAVPADAFFERVAGRVVGDDGAPVPGVRVKPMIDVLPVSQDGRIVMTNHADLEGMPTDAEGRFEFRRVPRKRVYLRVDGEGIFPVEHGRDAEGGLAGLCGGRMEGIDVPVTRRCHLKVEFAGPADAADEAGFQDDRGSEVMINVFSAWGRRETPRVPLTDGRSDTLAVPGTTRTLILFRGGQEVRRVPVRPLSGEVTIVRP